MEKERLIKDKLQKLVEEIKQAKWEDCEPEYMARLAEERINELQQKGVRCLDRFVKKLLERVGDKDAYLDILMEGRFAIILARNGFKEIQIEYSDVGPDIKAKYNGQTVYFEVTRRHADEDEWAEHNGAGSESSDRVENIIARVRGKLRQLQPSATNIIVFWSATVKVGEREMKEAFDYILKEDHETRAYKDLSGILLTEDGGVDITTMKQFHLFRNDNASKPIGADLGRKLRSLFERDVEEWQKEIEDLTAAVKQLKNNRNL